MTDEAKTRCWWATGNDPIYQAYHDTEWGKPVHDDHKFFEMLCLEGAQAGLSWITILRRRDGYRAAFDKFDVHKVAEYDESKVADLLQDTRIIRNGLKIRAFITNAKAFIRVQEDFGSFDTYVWQFVGRVPKINCFQTLTDVPAFTAESDAMSKALKKRGFKFVGSTICYAFMQACGLVNDHIETCYLHPCADK